MKYIEIKNKVKTRKFTWNEKLTRRGIPTWEMMQAEAKAI